MEIHHICNNPPCVNPAHLREVTHGQNVLLGHRDRKIEAGQMQLPHEDDPELHQLLWEQPDKQTYDYGE